MTKKEFLEKLKSKLDVLDEKEVNDIIEEYSEHIDEKIKNKVKEEKAIEEFGDIDELVEEILSAYKINKNYAKKSIPIVDDIVESSKEVFDKVIKIISHGKTKDVFKLLIYICVILVIVAVLKVPFSLLEGALDNFTYSLPDKIAYFFNSLIEVLLTIIYIVVGYCVFIKILKEKLLDGVVIEKEEVKVTTTSKSDNKHDNNVIVEKQIEKKIVYKNERTFLDSIGDLIKFCFKICAAFILFPFIAGTVFSSVGLAMLIFVSIKYVFLVGPIIGCVGVLLGAIWGSELLFRFILSKPSTFARSFITFVCSLVLIGLGIGLSIMQITKYDFKQKTFDNLLVVKNDIIYNENKGITCFDCTDVEKIVDNSLEENIINIKVYGDNNFKAVYEENHYTDSAKSYDIIKINNISPKNMFDKFMKDLKKGYIYDYYNEGNLKVVVYGNETTLQKFEME